MSKETGPAPAEAEGVNVPQRERAMPSIAELSAANKAEATAAERREKGETPSGALERIANEADARAQEKLLAQNTGFLNRITNVAKRGWDVVKGFGKMMGFVKEDIYNPIRDAARDLITGRKEDGEAVGATLSRIEMLQRAIPATSNEKSRGDLEAELTKAQEELERLRDPRKLAAYEKAQQKAEEAEGKAFMKSEDERLKAKKLAADATKLETDVEAAKKRHAEKLEREAMERDARVNLGRGAAMLIVKAAGEDPSTMTLSEAELSAIGTVIEGAKATAKIPDTVRAGMTRMGTAAEEYINDEAARARGAWMLTRSAVRGMLMADDIEEMVGNLVDAGKATKKIAGASLSITAAALMNKEVQDGVIEALGLEEHEKGDGSIESQSARGVLKNAIKGGALNNKKLITNAVTDLYKDIRDSEAVKDITPAAKAVGKGLKYTALGTGALIASPILVPGAAIYYGGKAAGRGYTLGMDAAKRGYDTVEAAAARKFMEVAPIIGDVIDPVLADAERFMINARNVPGDTGKEFARLGNDVHNVLMNTAEDINKNTRKAAEAYNTLATRMRALKAGAIALYNKLEAEAIAEAAKAKNPEAAEGVAAAIAAKEELEKTA